MRLLKKIFSQNSSKKSFQRKFFLRKIIPEENFSQRKSSKKVYVKENFFLKKTKLSQKDFFTSQKKTFPKSKKEILHKGDLESFQIDSNLHAMFLISIFVIKTIQKKFYLKWYL